MQTESNTAGAQPVTKDAVIVKLLKPHGIYNAGEVAGFRKELAEKLISKRVAERVTKAIERPPVDRQATPAVKK